MTAVLAQGRPALTTLGRLSEPVWVESGAAATAPDGDPAAFVAAAEALLADPAARDRLGAAASAAYDRHFAPERAIAGLIAD
jgi:hypothetical protein